jgi:hypothetical protein
MTLLQKYTALAKSQGSNARTAHGILRAVRDSNQK